MKISPILAILSTLALSAAAPAALFLQTDKPTYTVSTNGSTVTTVTISLLQTAPTTVVTDHGGLNQFQIKITPVVSTNAPTLSAVHVDSAFTGNKSEVPATGTLGGSFFTFTAGAPVTNGRTVLGTVNFTATSASAASTTYNITTPTSGYDYTASTSSSGADAVDIGSQITAGSFQLTVPEPSSLAVLGMGTLAMLHRRRV